MKTHHIPELQVRLDGILSCRKLGSHPPSVCHLVLARVPWRTSSKFGVGYNLRQCAYHIRQHYNNQELFQLQMVDKKTVLAWGILLSRNLQVLAASFPECFPPDCIAELKCNHFCGGLPKCLKAMVAYLKASPQEKTYSDYLQAGREAEKEDSMELSQSP